MINYDWFLNLRMEYHEGVSQYFNLFLFISVIFFYLFLDNIIKQLCMHWSDFLQAVVSEFLDSFFVRNESKLV